MNLSTISTFKVKTEIKTESDDLATEILYGA